MRSQHCKHFLAFVFNITPTCNSSAANQMQVLGHVTNAQVPKFPATTDDEPAGASLQQQVEARTAALAQLRPQS